MSARRLNAKSSAHWQIVSSLLKQESSFWKRTVPKTIDQEHLSKDKNYRRHLAFQTAIVSHRLNSATKTFLEGVRARNSNVLSEATKFVKLSESDVAAAKQEFDRLIGTLGGFSTAEVHRPIFIESATNFEDAIKRAKALIQSTTKIIAAIDPILRKK